MRALVLVLGLIASQALAAEPPATARVVAAQAFELERPLHYPWDRTQPPSTRGWLLALEAAPALLAERQAAQPVPWVGGHLAHRASRAGLGGRLVVVVPADVDLSTALVVLGAPALPEQLTSEDAARELRRATEHGLQPRPLEEIARARELGGPILRLADEAELGPHVTSFRERFGAEARP